MRHGITRQHGIALVSAIFLLVALAAMGAYMVTLSGVSLSTTDRALLGARTYFGAKAGLDWGVQRTITDATPPGNCTAIGAGTSFTLTGTALDGIAVTVTCASTPHGTNFVYYLTSTAKYGTAGSPYYAERKLEATFSNIR